MTGQDRVVVITGATGALGRVAAQRFAAAGCRLALVSTNGEKLRAVVEDLDLQLERVLIHASNLAEPGAGSKAAEAIVAKFGRVDILLHLIGGYEGGKSIVDFTSDRFAAMLEQHFWTTLYTLQAFVPHLTAKRWGRIIVISSPSAARPPGKDAPYATAKAALEALVLSLARELKGSGVTANVIVVKAIDTRPAREGDSKTTNLVRTTPEEIVAAMLYLCSENGRVLNGVRLPLYGET